MVNERSSPEIASESAFQSPPAKGGGRLKGVRDKVLLDYTSENQTEQ